MSEPITVAAAAKLLERMSGLPNWPAAAAARKALAEMLASKAKSHNHAFRIVTQLEETSFFAPTPATIAQTALQVPAELHIPMGCVNCHGSGWHSVKRKRMCSDGTRGPGKLVEVDAAERCSCPRGQLLKQLYEQSDEYRKSKKVTS